MTDVLQTMTDIAMRSNASISIDPQDYLQDGIYYCYKCKTAKQHRITIAETSLVVNCLCSCALQEEKRVVTAHKEEQRYNELKTALDDYHINVKAKEEYAHPLVKRWLDKLDIMKATNAGLLLWGNNGRGKSQSAAWVVNELRKKKQYSIFTNFETLFGQFGNVPKLTAPEVVVIDDFGAERETATMTAKAFEVIDRRVNAGKLMIITTNLTLDQLKNPKSLEQKRMYDRILGATVPISFVGESYRKDVANDKLKRAKELLK